MTARPADEMDITLNCKAFGLLHPDTQEAFRCWPHGVVFLNNLGEWIGITESHYIKASACYRAKPAPVPNLIKRVGVECCTADVVLDLWKALKLADALINDPYNADLRAAFNEAFNEAIK